MKKEHLDILNTLISLAARNELQGRFNDIPIEVYHHPKCPGISSTRIKSAVDRSLSHHKSEKPLVFGNAFHAFANEPEIFRETYMQGDLAIGVDDLKCIEAMNRKLKRHPDVVPLYENVVHEQTFFAIDPETGLLLKARFDGYIEDKSIIWDLKSCRNASQLAFQYDAKKFLYRISAAFYLTVASLVMKKYHNDFRLVACEKEDPHEVAVYRVDDRSIATAEIEIRNVLNKIKNPELWQGYDLGVKNLTI